MSKKVEQHHYLYSKFFYAQSILKIIIIKYFNK